METKNVELHRQFWDKILELPHPLCRPFLVGMQADAPSRTDGQVLKVFLGQHGTDARGQSNLNAP